MLAESDSEQSSAGFILISPICWGRHWGTALATLRSERPDETQGCRERLALAGDCPVLAGASPTGGRRAHASVPHVGASHSETYKLLHDKPTPPPCHTSARMASLSQPSRSQDEKPLQSRAHGPPSSQLYRAVLPPAPRAGWRPLLGSPNIPETHRHRFLLPLTCSGYRVPQGACL